MNSNIKNKYYNKAQGLVEFMMVFLFAAVVMYAVSMMFDFKALKSFSVYGIVDKNNANKIIVPPMSE